MTHSLKGRPAPEPLRHPVALGLMIEAELSAAVHALAVAESRTIADIVRTALAEYLALHPAPRRKR